MPPFFRPSMAHKLGSTLVGGEYAENQRICWMVAAQNCMGGIALLIMKLDKGYLVQFCQAFFRRQGAGYIAKYHNLFPPGRENPVFSTSMPGVDKNYERLWFDPGRWLREKQY